MYAFGTVGLLLPVVVGSTFVGLVSNGNPSRDPFALGGQATIAQDAEVACEKLSRNNAFLPPRYCAYCTTCGYRGPRKQYLKDAEKDKQRHQETNSTHLVFASTCPVPAVVGIDELSATVLPRPASTQAVIASRSSGGCGTCALVRMKHKGYLQVCGARECSDEFYFNGKWPPLLARLRQVAEICEHNYTFAGFYFAAKGTVRFQAVSLPLCVDVVASPCD